MNQRPLLNLILLGLVLGLAVFVFYPPKDKTAPSITLTPLQTDAINAIKIDRPNQNSIELVQTDSGWQMVSPISAPAQPSKIDRLLKIAVIPSSTQYPLNSDNLTLYGLQPPTATVQFNETQIQVGGVEPISNRRYVRVGDSLHLLDDTFAHHLLGSATDYLDTRILPDAVQITRLQLPELTLAYRAEQGWIRSDQPEQVLPQDKTQILIDEWRFARAIRVEQINEPFQGQDALITFENQPGLHLLIDNQPEHLRIANPALGLIYHFSHTKAEQMMRLPPTKPEKTN